MMSRDQKAISRYAMMGSILWHLRDRRAWHANKATLRTWETLLFLRIGVLMNKPNKQGHQEG